MTQAILQFRDERDWKQFHTPKDMVMGLTAEAAELLELFLWRSGSELDEYLEKRREDVSDELADVLFWVLLIAHDLHIDLPDALNKKLEKTKKKYPIEKAKGRAAKYNEL